MVDSRCRRFNAHRRNATTHSTRKEIDMNTTNRIAAALLMLTLAAGAAHAAKDAATTDAPAAKAPTGQQSKMGSCNKEAHEKTLKGAERKAFMRECLSSKKAAK
jgi:hypothetical protein